MNIPILLHPAARVYEAQHSHPWLVGSERFQGYQHFPTALGFPLTYMVSASRLIFGGVLDRFPTLKFGFFEGGIGWVPWLMHTLDAHMPNDATISISVQQFFEGKQGIKKKPSQYFDQFFIACVSWETYIADTVNGWPNHNIIIGSDFDHGDAVATWPRTVDVIKQMKALSAADKEKILGGNAMKMFGLTGNGGPLKSCRLSSRRIRRLPSAVLLDFVIPAKAGIQVDSCPGIPRWMPVFTGMTNLRVSDIAY